MTTRRTRRLALSAAVFALALTTVTAATTTASTAATLPAVKHVWVIMLENEDYAGTFGSPKADPYLARTLPAKGALLTKYYGTGHESMDNYAAIVSGQPPNPDTQSDCQMYSGFVGGAVNGIESGAGCVYPSTIKNIGNQLTASGRSWKAYQQDMGNVASREAAACGHPALNTQDKTQKAVAGDGYATRHDPFVYFDSVTSSASYCNRHVVALGTRSGRMPKAALKGETGLATDLKKIKTTPAYSFITPNLCSDGHDYPCTNRKSGASALADIDGFLKRWVTKIMKSPAYKKNGLIEITFDESDGPQSDSSACCGEKPGPDSIMPGITGPGGGRIGAVLLSPFIKPGTKSSVAYNHYSTLATMEKLFGLPRLGEARTVPATFGPDVFTRR